MGEDFYELFAVAKIRSLIKIQSDNEKYFFYFYFIEL